MTDCSITHKQWAELLKDCRFQDVADCFRLMFQMGSQEAEEQEQGGEWYYLTELLDVVVPFMKNPCLDTAIAFLNRYPTFYESVFLIWCRPRLASEDSSPE